METNACFRFDVMTVNMSRYVQQRLGLQIQRVEIWIQALLVLQRCYKAFLQLLVTSNNIPAKDGSPLHKKLKYSSGKYGHKTLHGCRFILPPGENTFNIKCLHTNIYKHLDVRNGDSRLNTSHQAELSPLRLCSGFSALRRVSIPRSGLLNFFCERSRL